MKEIIKDEFVSDWSVYPNFQEWEFACPSSGKAYMQKRFMDKLQRARTIAGVRFHISSGYRDEAYNDSLPNSVPNSAHIYGLACDIWVDSMLDRLKAFDAFRDVGIKRIGVAKGFMHVDVDESKPEGILGLLGRSEKIKMKSEKLRYCFAMILNTTPPSLKAPLQRGELMRAGMPTIPVIKRG